MRRAKLATWALAAAAAGAATGELVRRWIADRRAQPPRVDPPLDAVNDQFHDAYDRAREGAARDAPVFVVLADSLVVRHRDQRREIHVTPPSFHIIKSAAHAPVAIYAMLQRDTEHASTHLHALARKLELSLASVDAELADPDVATDVKETLEASRAFVDRAIASDDRALPGAASTFARDTGPLLLRLTAHATRIQLASLHQAVEKALAGLDADERRALQVVVTGDHQARARSLGMQYFRKRLREPDGAEDRVTYGEGVSDEAAAFALVGTRRFDRAIAAAFFGDEKRLQRDILGDATKAELNGTDLTPIV